MGIDVKQFGTTTLSALQVSTPGPPSWMASVTLFNNEGGHSGRNYYDGTFERTDPLHPDLLSRSSTFHFVTQRPR